MTVATQFDALPPVSSVGTFAATNGSRTLTGSGTVYAGDQVVLQNAAGFVGLVASDNAGGDITLSDPWAGASASGTLYRIEETISEEIAQVFSDTNQLGTLAQRAAYNAQAEGFTYLVTDSPATTYIRLGPAGTWFDLATNAFVYVDPVLGDDTLGNGSYELPLKTINAALGLVADAEDMTGMQIHVVLRAGTYNQQVNLRDVKGAPLGCRIVAETSLGGTHSQSLYTISFAGDVVRAIRLKTAWEIVGVTVASSKGHCLLAKAAPLKFNQLKFNATTGSHISALGGGTITLSGSGYTIAGGANAHWNANGSGAVIDLQAEAITKPTIAITLNPTKFTAAFAWARASGQIFTGTGLIFTGKDFVKNNTRRWRAEQNSSIDSGQSGEKYLPGDQPGVAVKSGEYL